MNTTTLTPAVLRRALLGLGTAAVLAVGALAATSWSTVEILADGDVHEVRLTSGTVADALDDAEVDLAADDDVHPELDTEVEGDLQIVVARSITVDVVVDDEEPVTVTAPVSSVDGAVRLAGLADLRAEGAVATPSWHEPITDGEVIAIRRPVEVTLEADGDQRTVITLAAQVEDLLSLNDVELGPDDRVSPAPSAALRADQLITVERVEYVEATEEVVLARDEVRRNSSSLDRGRTQVEDEGRDGLRRDEYRLTLVDGEEVERELVGGEVVRQPRDRVVLVGTRAPAPAGAATASSSVWDRLAQCESGGNWQINTGNGYYGGLQFHPQTWRSVGGSGLPHQASKAEQIHRAQILQARSGWGQWPACSRKLGLR
ncbi:MAG: transglycosylase family protein [Nitriliruptoraceae bacterium]